MTNPKPLASLSSTLLARKGSASPAMRSQLTPLDHHYDDTAPVGQDDLGWNDMGAEFVSSEMASQVVPITSDSPVTNDSDLAVPQVHEQQAAIAAKFTETNAPNQQRRSALGRGRSALGLGRPAAFTLRIDGERHLKLRMACTVQGRSAQQLLIHALDCLLEDCPEASHLAAQVHKNTIKGDHS